ncbi:MAG TPA: ATP-binding protein [Polyangia bacterium]|nr:ATP-binding protein [Polyangia bacterium]
MRPTVDAAALQILALADAVVFEAALTPLRLTALAGGAVARLGLGADRDLLSAALHAEDRERFLVALAAVGRDGEPRRIEHRLVGADDGVRWFRTELHATTRDHEPPRPTPAAGGAMKGEPRVGGFMIDVTDARLTTEALRSAESRLMQVIDHAPIILFAIDATGRFTLSQGRGLQAFGNEPGRAVGRDLFSMWRDEPEVLAHARRALAGEQFTVVDHTRRFGSSWQTSWSPIFDESGRPIGASGVALDITETLRAEEEVATSVSLLRATLESINDAVLVVDGDAHIVGYNQRFLQLWNVPPALIADVDDSRAIVHAAQQLRDPSKFIERVESLYREPEATSHDVLELRDGRIFERDSRPQRVDGRAVGRVWSFRDVTAERRASRRAGFLAAASKLLGGPVEDDTPLDGLARLSVPFLGDWCNIFLIDDSGTIVSAAAYHREAAHVPKLLALRVASGSDRGVARVVGRGEPLVFNDISDAELDGRGSRPVLAINYPSNADTLREIGFGAYMLAPLRVRGQTLGAMCFAMQDHRRHYDDEDLAIAIDLAQRAALALDNQRLYQESQAAVASRDEFLSVASHELRTPVTSLQLAVQSVLAIGEEAPTAFLRQALETAERQTRRLSRLVDSLLDVSRVHSDRLELQREPTDLVAVAQDAVRALGDDARRAGCAIAVEAPAPVLGSAWDRARLEQVATNLLSNALKYGAGKPVIVRVDSDGARAQLRVRDHGIGVEPAERGRIFERFERAVSARHYGGLGLGLYIVRRIVEAHGGTVSAHDVDGEGASFVVELPL